MTTQAYIHQTIPGAAGGPLLVLLHGTGGDEHQLVGLGRELVPDATLVAARGDVSENGAARFFRRTGEGIYDMADLERATRKMIGFVRAAAERIEPSAIYGLGYSNGANILAAAIFAAPGLFDAAVLMHPLIPFAPRIDGDLSGRRILITAGRRDPICPPELTGRLDAWLRAARADVTLYWHPGGHELLADEIEAARSFFADTTLGV